MASQLHSAAETASKFYKSSQEFMEDASGQAKEFYGKAREWVPEHSGAIAAAAGAGLLIGFIGYRIGKGRSLPELREAIEEPVSKIGGTDFRPLLKFLKLYLLYRASV